MERWRLILDEPLDGAENMAVDEAMLRAVETGAVRTPTLRLYSWKGPVVSIGYRQSAARLSGLGLPLVRRITGGRAVLHDMELTYSVVAGDSCRIFRGGITGAYSAISESIVAALGDAGVEAAFERAAGGRERDEREACFYAPARYEVCVGGRKLVGSAQRRFRNALLQHGSILLDVNRELHVRLFGAGIVERMAWLGSCPGFDAQGFRDRLVERMACGLGASFELAGLTDAESYMKEKLLEQRFLFRDSNLPGAHQTTGDARINGA